MQITDTFKDNANKPIIAFDFDGTLNKANIFPNIGEPRKYAQEVVNLLHDLGVIVLVWTCRDKTLPARDCKIYDDQASMIEWLATHGFKYHDINSSIKHAPFHYEARKIYAHMYVDDKAFGWEDREDIMLDVLEKFMVDVMRYSRPLARHASHKIRLGEEININMLKEMGGII